MVRVHQVSNFFCPKKNWDLAAAVLLRDGFEVSGLAPRTGFSDGTACRPLEKKSIKDRKYFIKKFKIPTSPSKTYI